MYRLEVSMFWAHSLMSYNSFVSLEEFGPCSIIFIVNMNEKRGFCQPLFRFQPLLSLLLW